LFNICDSSTPGMDGDVYRLPYGEAVEGMRHGYEVRGKTRTGKEWSRGVTWTRNPNHPPDPKCPECSAPTPPPAREAPAPRKRTSVHVPPENLVRYRRIMNLARHVERIGNQRSNRGDYAGANRAWSRASRISAEAQTLRVPGNRQRAGGV
jgi:hypothetical protein